MKITPKTFQLLKNFSGINSSIYVDRGNVIRTMSESRAVVAHATVQEMFPREFGIYDLNQFLGVVSLFTDPDFEFDTTYMTIGGQEKTNSRYYYSSKDMHVMPPQSVKMPNSVCSFILSEKNLKSLMQAANVMGLPEVVVQGGEGVIRILATNTKNNNSNNWYCDLGEYKGRFKAIFKVENIKLQYSTYEVCISDKGIAEFKLPDDSLRYWIATDSKSTYSE